MADTKISALTDGTTANATDQIPVARSGANRYITTSYIRTYLLGQDFVVQPTFMVGAYNLNTDASNYERGIMRYVSNTLRIGHEYAGTGVNRFVEIHSGGAVKIRYDSTNDQIFTYGSGVRFQSGGDVLQVTNNRLGYGTGSGGSVTQATSKSTGVTLNTSSGAITMNAAALAAGASVQFTLTNSKIDTSSLVICKHASAGTLGSYRVDVNSGGSGSAKITVTNTSAGSLSEAIVLGFCLLQFASA